MDERRIQRVTEALREELNELISHELEDPRLQGAQVAEVQVSPDLSRAWVRLVVAGDAARQKGAVEAATRAKALIKRHIAERLELFRIPELRFEAALAPGHNPRVKALLRRARRGRPRMDTTQPIEEKSERKP